jgi:hypothetical protein
VPVGPNRRCCADPAAVGRDQHFNFSWAAVQAVGVIAWVTAVIAGAESRIAVAALVGMDAAAAPPFLQARRGGLPALTGTDQLPSPFVNAAGPRHRFDGSRTGEHRRQAPAVTTKAATPYVHAWRGKPGRSRPAR